MVPFSQAEDVPVERSSAPMIWIIKFERPKIICTQVEFEQDMHLKCAVDASDTLLAQAQVEY